VASLPLVGTARPGIVEAELGPATRADLRRKVKDFEWWATKLREMTENPEGFTQRSLKPRPR
jgi:hypothetical protein